MEGPGFAGADSHGARNVVLDLRDLFLGHLHQAHHFFRPFAEHHAFFSEGDLPVSADEKGYAEFFLQLLHLPRQRGLGDVQRLSRRGDRAFPNHSQIVLHCPYIHE